MEATATGNVDVVVTTGILGIMPSNNFTASFSAGPVKYLTNTTLGSNNTNANANLTSANYVLSDACILGLFP